MASLLVLFIFTCFLALSSDATERAHGTCPLASRGLVLGSGVTALLYSENSDRALHGYGGPDGKALLRRVLRTGAPAQRCMRLVGGVIEGSPHDRLEQSSPGTASAGNGGVHLRRISGATSEVVEQGSQGSKGAGRRKSSRALRDKGGRQMMQAVVTAVGAAMLSSWGPGMHPLTTPHVRAGAFLFGLAGLSGLPATHALEGGESLFQGAEPVAPNVSIQPPFLDWQEVYICEPATISVEVINTSEEAELTLFSVSTDNQQFFPSAFHQVSIPPGGSVNISLAFLPVASGSADSTLLVQSNAGGFLVQMHGWGVASHLRAAPVTGRKTLVGRSFTHSLVLHNPYSELLRVTEVFTLDDFLQLTLPKSLQPGAAGLWEIAPHEARSVIEIEFQSKAPGKQSGLVHVAYGTVNGAVEGTLVIPVEVEAVQGGLFTQASEFDFGTLTVPGERRELPLVVTNLGEKPVDVFDIYVEPDGEGVSISGFEWMKGAIVPPGTEQVVARVSFSGEAGGSKSGGKEPHWASGVVVINSNSTVGTGAHMKIPFWARAVYGSLGFDSNKTSFLVEGESGEEWRGKTVVQAIQLVNNFRVPVSFYSAAIPGDQNFEIVWLSSGHVAAPGAPGPLVTLTFRPTHPGLDYSTSLLVATNVTTLRVPIRIHPGRLQFFTVPKGRQALSGLIENPDDISVGEAMDFGVVAPEHVQRQLFVVLNPTPEPVHIAAVSHPAPLTGLRVSAPQSATRILETLPAELAGLGFLWDHNGGRERFVGASPVGAAKLEDQVFEQAVTRDPFTLESGQIVIVGLAIRPPEKEGRFEDSVLFVTRRGNLTVPFSYEVVRGGLRVTIEPAEIQAYPGRVQEAVVIAENMFDRELLISSLDSEDQGFSASAYRQYLHVGIPTEVGVVDIDLLQAVGNYLGGARFRKWRQRGGCKGQNCRAVTPLQLQEDLESVQKLDGIKTAVFGGQVS
jgi:hypothetical protein